MFSQVVHCTLDLNEVYAKNEGFWFSKMFSTAHPPPPPPPTLLQICWQREAWTKPQNFILLDIEGPCRRNMKLVHRMKFVLDRVESIRGKGENSGYRHFLLFSQCAQKSISMGLLELGIVWVKVKHFILPYTLSSIYTHFNTLRKKALWKHCGKRWNCSNEHFHLFPQCFLWNLYLKIL